jgi:WD40 repeat protein
MDWKAFPKRRCSHSSKCSSAIDAMNSSAAPLLLNPFPGLRPFREDEEHLFFGRESQVDTMVDKLARTRFLAVVGTSGSGKSSLVNSGLRPALHRGLMAKAGTSWKIAQFRPGSNPIRAMARALADKSVLFGDYQPEGVSLIEIIEATLRMSKLGLVDIYEQAQPGEGVNLLVVADQFEELFRYHKKEGDRASGEQDQRQEAVAFVNLLLEATAQAKVPLYVVLTMRSDFLGDCAQFPGLAEAINEGQYLVPRLTREERKAAIAGPVGVGGGKISPVLLTRLVNDVGDNPDQLSILQHALNRTWSRWQYDGRGEGPLSLSHYEAIGTMSNALDQHAEKAYADLGGERQQQICEKIFKALTDGTDARGIRRPTGLATLCALADASQAEVMEVIDIFRKPSRSFVMPPLSEGLEPDTVIDISHESLMRVWERLKVWAVEEARSARRYRRLWETAMEHVANKAGLLRDPELQLSLDWRQGAKPNAAWAGLYGGDFDTAMGFLTDSDEEQKKDKREKEERQKRELAQAQAFAAERARSAHRLRIGLAFAAVLAVVAVVTAFWAIQQRAVAERQTQLATARQLAAQAQVGAVRTPYNLLLALESISITQKIGTFSPTASRQLLADLLNTTGGIPLQCAAPVKAVGFSPGDRWLAAASAGVVQLWDMQAPSTAPVTLGGQNNLVNALTFSPDGRTLAIVGDDTGVRLWDMATVNRAASARVLETHNAHLVDVAFSPDNRWLATASMDGTAQLWDLAAADPATANSILRHDKSVNTLTFSPDNRWLATGSSDKTVRMWDLLSPNPSTGPILLQVKMDVRKVAFSPDSQWLVAGAAGSYTVVLTRVAAPDHPFPLKVDQYVLAVAFSPDGRWVATPSAYDVRLWDLNTADPSIGPLILPGHKSSITDLAFSPDGKWLATGSADHTVQLWNVANVANQFTAPAVLRGHEGSITGLAFSHDSRHLATASADRTVRLWKTTSPAAEPLVLRTPDSATELHVWNIRPVDLPEVPRVLGDKLEPGAGSVFSPDGQWIASIQAGGAVDLWKLSAPLPTHYPLAHPGRIWAAPVFSPDGRWLATGGADDPTIRLWDLKSPKPQSDPHLLRGHKGPVRSLAFSADGRRLVSGAGDGLALVWDLTADPSPSPKKRLAGGYIKAVAISADGRRVVTGSWGPDYDARIWDLSSPFSSSNPIKLTFADRVFDVAISPNGRWVAAGSWDLTTQTQLLDLSKPGAKPFVLRGHNTARTLSVAFSPDSQWLATGNEDQTASLWNLAAADPSLDSTVLQAPYKVGSVSFSPDGRWLALNLTEYRTNPFSPDGNRFVSSSTDTRLYHVRLEDLIGLADRTAGRNLTKTEWELSFGDQPYRKTCPQLP